MSSYSARKRRSMSKDRPKEPIVFLGDTLVYHWCDQGSDIWESLYAPLNAVNHASVNDSTQMLIEKLERDEIPLDGTRTAVLMIGATDLRFRLKEIIVVQQIRRIIQLLQQSSPGIKILVLGIMPRGWDKDLNTSIQDTNELLSDVENGFTIRYLDMYTHFVDATGKVNEDLYDNDGINLSARGYQVWADVMAKVFNDCLGSNNL